LSRDGPVTVPVRIQVNCQRPGRIHVVRLKPGRNSLIVDLRLERVVHKCDRRVCDLHVRNSHLESRACHQGKSMWVLKGVHLPTVTVYLDTGSGVSCQVCEQAGLYRSTEVPKRPRYCPTGNGRRLVSSAIARTHRPVARARVDPPLESVELFDIDAVTEYALKLPGATRVRRRAPTLHASTCFGLIPLAA
jgi:hypothetical protein